MKKFKFTLEKLRSYRQSRLEEQQARMLSLVAEQAVLEERRAGLERQEMDAMQRIRQAKVVSAEELTAVEGFRQSAARERLRLRSAAVELVERIERQREALLEARREVEALSRLREQRLDAWRAEVDRETEIAVAELVIARWQRGGEVN